mgnify:CR=1 FL=1
MEIRPNAEKDVFDENGVYQKDKKKDNADFNILASVGSGLFGLLLIVYIVLSVCLPEFKAPSGYNAWATFWPILFLADIPVSIVRAIKKKCFCEFSIWGVALFTYLFLGMYGSYWHPYWVILLSIPAYYFVFKPIDKLLKTKRN